jgi:hypothetical protein
MAPGERRSCCRRDLCGAIPVDRLTAISLPAPSTTGALAYNNFFSSSPPSTPKVTVTELNRDPANWE